MTAGILAIDQGTTNTKVVIVDSTGNIIAQASTPLSQSYPQPAWVEQDAQAIWQSVQSATSDCLAQLPHQHIAAIAISNQRESVTAWDRRTGQPLGPVVIWQCRRTAAFCQTLREQGHEAWLAARTGLTIDPLFSASKMRWLLDHITDGQARAQRGEICLGTMDSWVLWNLTGGQVHACDLTNASRTQLLNIHTGQWDDDLLQLFGIPRAALPEIHPSKSHFGVSVAHGNLPTGIPICSMIGDSHAALFGQAGFAPGTIKATYGTGSSLMTPTPAPVLSKNGLSTTIAWALDDQHITYALEGNIAVSGAAVQWLGEFLGLDQPTAQIAAMAATVSDSTDIYFVPALVGLGAPHWHAQARGLISGLTHGATINHLARAAVDAIAYQVRDVFEVMQAESGTPLTTLLADGGASRNAQLMQFQADILGCPVQRNTAPAASLLGAAYIAGLSVGIWHTLDDIHTLARTHDVFVPKMEPDQRKKLTAGWQTAIARAMLDRV